LLVGDIDYGVFGAYCFTKPSSTRLSHDLILKTMEEIRDAGITEGELKWAKDSILNNFIFSFTSSHQIVVETIDLEYNHLPADFLRTYQGKISQVTSVDRKGQLSHISILKMRSFWLWEMRALLISP